MRFVVKPTLEVHYSIVCSNSRCFHGLRKSKLQLEYTNVGIKGVS